MNIPKQVKDYAVGESKLRPFFYAVGDKDYRMILDELSESFHEVLRLSSFCLSDDRFPDIDGFINALNSNQFCRNGRSLLVLGLGEYLAMKGNDYACYVLSRIVNVSSHSVFLLRCMSDNIKEMAENDTRLIQQGRIYISTDTECNISLINAGLAEKDGIKFLLMNLENGASGVCRVNTCLDLGNSLFRVHNGAYEAICYFGNTGLASEEGSNEQWNMLLDDMNSKKTESLNELFDSYNFHEGIYENSADEYKSWLYFLYLKHNSENIKNAYLMHVVKHTESFIELRKNLIAMIADISPDEKDFRKLYAGRKSIVKHFNEGDMLSFISSQGNHGISYLTDSTRLEREEIIRYVSRNGITEELREVYPALYFYASRYDFPKEYEYLTEYFERYKTCKLRNEFDDEFMKLSEYYAGNMKHTEPETRDNVTARYMSDENFLLWIDALGAEYLAYIKHLAESKRMSAEIHITRANLPTITGMNREFYDLWPENMRRKEDRLDDIKHEDSPKDNGAEYLSRELEIIEEAVNYAYTELENGRCRKFIIAGDHGASRAAVIAGHDEKYECASRGEHSGRYCEYFEGCDVLHAIYENGCIILTDYGRFRGGRVSGHELHGGASPEEIIVPVIVLSFQNRSRAGRIRSDFDDIFTR